MTSDAKPNLTRRQFSRLMAGSAAGMLCGDAGEAQAAPQGKPQTPAEDPRIALLEKARAAPFTPAQRAALPAQLKDLDDTGKALRAFQLADGGSEPCFVFRPGRSQK